LFWVTMMRLSLLNAIIVLASLASLSAHADELSIVSNPETLGFSSARLARISSWFQDLVDSREFPGAVIAVARDGELAYLEAIGFQDRGKQIPIKPDSIFWIASMTKPITSVAAMILVEEGKLDLDAPVAQYLPELKDMQVATENTDPTTGKVELTYAPQKRSMTVRDLLRHTSGLVYPPQYLDSPIHRLYRKAVFTRDTTLAEFVTSLGKPPLAHQPGEVWEYSWGVDVLARIVEVQSGQTFDDFLKSRVFEPLHMVDSGFYVPDEKLGRLVDPPDEQRERLWEVTTKPKLFSGGGGLVSTAPDYLRFCEMLLNGGELDGARVLKTESVRLMTTNSLPPDILFGLNFVGPASGSTWGLGFAVRTNPEESAVPGSVGSYTWSGAGGTLFWIDPAQNLIVIAMIQSSKATYRAVLRQLTYGALKVSQETPKPFPGAVAAEKLADYAGTYDFGFSTSAANRQNATGGVGIASAGMAEGALKVTAVVEGGSAAAVGIAPGDLITRIDGTPVKEMAFSEIVAKDRGAVGSKVTVEVLHSVQKGRPEEVTITRGPLRSHEVELRVRVDHGKLVVDAVGAWPILDFGKERSVELESQSDSEFYVDGGDHTRLAFIRDSTSKVSEIVLNPGPWEQRGRKLD
jgi:CubicO group peptidase (beta-lactamase class C family)